MDGKLKSPVEVFFMTFKHDWQVWQKGVNFKLFCSQVSKLLTNMLGSSTLKEAVMFGIFLTTPQALRSYLIIPDGLLASSLKGSRNFP